MAQGEPERQALLSPLQQLQKNMSALVVEVGAQPKTKTRH